MNRIIFHIDVNSAFLSWTAIKLLEEGKDNAVNTDIREIASIIGGDQQIRHGVVLAKSTSAKKYGIVTGEPIVNALKKCPNLRIVNPDMEYYKEQSHKFIKLLLEYTPEIEQVSIDECYMDFTSIKKKFNSPMEAAVIIKDRIYKELGFTVNIGISDCKLLAKMASDFQKPNKVHTLYRNEIQKKMWPLPIEELLMVGKSSAKTLRNLGIKTIGELAGTPQDIIISNMKSHGKMIWEYANGIDDSKVETEQIANKGVGNSTTMPEDTDNPEIISRVLMQLSDSVAERLRKMDMKAGMVSVEVKYNNFARKSHQEILQKPTNIPDIIHESAYRLFLEMWDKTPIRLLGIRTSKLVEQTEPMQLNIFDVIENIDNLEKNGKISEEKLIKAHKAVDIINSKYGKNTLVRGSSLENHKDS